MSQRAEVPRELLVKYTLLQNQLENVQKQITALNAIANEISVTIDELKGLKNIGDEADAYIPLGNLVYVKGKIIRSDKVLVNIGARVVVEKSVDEAERILLEKLDEIRKSIDELQKDASVIAEELRKTEDEIRKYVEK